MMQVPIHVPGDRETVIGFLKKNNISYVTKGGQIIIKNTYIHLHYNSIFIKSFAKNKGPSYEDLTSLSASKSFK